MTVSEEEIDNFIIQTQDFDLADALMRKKEQSHKKVKTTMNEFGDKIGKREICQGILLFGALTGMIACACVRGCQEINRHLNKSDNKAKVIQIQNNNQNMR